MGLADDLIEQARRRRAEAVHARQRPEPAPVPPPAYFQTPVRQSEAPVPPAQPPAEHVAAPAVAERSTSAARAADDDGWDARPKWGHYEDDDDYSPPVVRDGGRAVVLEEVFTPPPPESKIMGVGEVPGVLVVPAFPLGRGEEARMLLEMWEQPGDVTLAVGYSTQAKLVEQLGAHQPWMLLTTGQFQGLLQTGKVTALVVDPEPGVVSPRWSKQAVDALAAMNEGEA